MGSQFGAMPSQPAQQMFGGQQSNMSAMGQLGGAFGQMGLGGGSVPPAQASQQQSNPFADLGSFEKKPQQQQATAAPTSNIDLFGWLTAYPEWQHTLCTSKKRHNCSSTVSFA